MRILLSAAVLLLVMASATSPAGAEDFISALFGGLFRAVPAALPFADPGTDTSTDLGVGRSTGVRSGTAFCVRLCDGRYFPVPAGNTEGGTGMCNAMCPASSTALFYGADIEAAHSSSGTRYDELPNAFVYRDRLIDGCTCNGKSPFGLAAIDIKSDPTLRSGDVVATAEKLTVFSGRGNGRNTFTPIANAGGLRDAYQRRFATTGSSRLPD